MFVLCVLSSEVVLVYTSRQLALPGSGLWSHAPALRPEKHFLSESPSVGVFL